MGWLKLGNRQSSITERVEESLKAVTEHIESVSTTGDSRSENRYPFCDPSIPFEQLPFIDSIEVKKHHDTRSDGLCKFSSTFSILKLIFLGIVIDNVVFDCSAFAFEHPGGENIINSFGGEECSWQFWRFHGNREMNDFGVKLRIGRTCGLVNRYKEPARYVGLRKLDMDDW